MFKIRALSVLLGLLAVPFCVNMGYAQSLDALGTFTPYSLFGVGEVTQPGTSFNRAMGGIGTGVRDNRYINYLNPAAASAHDTLAFMIDVGLLQNNFLDSDGKAKSAYNVFNMHHILMSFPIYKQSAMQLGIVPYSNVGYKFTQEETRKDILSAVGDLWYYHYGQGSINQAFLAYSATFFKHVSIGVQGMYYFGNIERNAETISLNGNASYGTLYTGYDIVIGSFGGQAGIQVHGNLSPKTSFTVGGTYQMASKMKGDVTRFAKTESSSGIDTVYSVTTNGSQMGIPAEWTAGFSLRGRDKWMIGFDYRYSDWSKSGFATTPGVNFQAVKSSTYKLGVEFIPDRYSVRYFMRRLTYRLGAYYDKSYMSLNGQQVNAMGITFGFAVPIYRWYNAISVSVDLGQRGSLSNNMVRERYAMFILDFNLHDIWFVKHRYE